MKTIRHFLKGLIEGKLGFKDWSSVLTLSIIAVVLAFNLYIFKDQIIEDIKVVVFLNSIIK